MNNYVNGDILIGDLVRDYPETVDVLTAAGMHCLGCAASQAESLENACAVHCIEAAPVIEAVNKKIAEIRA